MILIELIGAVDVAGTLKTFYLSSDQFTTEPTDTPPNQWFDDVLIDPGSIGTHAYSDGKTSGNSKLETGEISLTNIDGIFDAWGDYSFAGRPVIIRSGVAGAYPAAFPIIFQGTVENLEMEDGKIVVRLRDKQYLLNVPLLTNRFAGNNVLPNGFEGTADDLGGKVKPRCFGTVLNIAPILVNTSLLIYQVNDGAVAAVRAVYDGGAALQFQRDYATKQALAAGIVNQGFFCTCVAEGFFRIGFAASQQVTADVDQGATQSKRTVAQILAQLAQVALKAGEISVADVAALDTFNSAVVGLWVEDDSTTILSAMDQVAASINAWYAFDSNGTLRMGVLKAPEGAPALSLEDADLLAGLTRRPAGDNGFPAWCVTIPYARCWTVQTSGLVGTATQERRAFVAMQSRTVTASASDVKAQHALATTMALDGLLLTQVSAQDEAQRQLVLRRVPRAFYDVPIPVERFSEQPVLIGDLVRLSISQYGLKAGRLFRVIGIEHQLQGGKVTLSVWG